MKVRLNDGPLCGREIDANVSDGCQAIQFPMRNPKDRIHVWGDPNVRYIEDEKWDRVHKEVRDPSTGEWERIQQFLSLTYRVTGRTTPDGVAVWDYQSPEEP